ncbi:MAG: pentapeptide repeat-containing protein [Gammaproteobacteria bacterium]|nr:pentapeptide repeat-containing protein [Gammaproteobacteria bacterium]
MDKKYLQFDLLTQRFIVKRWATPVGKEVRQKIIDAIENSQDVRKVLEPYVLEHAANIDPYNYPYYPPDAMEEEEFWVLTTHDLQGIVFENKNFADSESLIKQNLSYAKFIKCNLSKVSFRKTDLSFIKFNDCDLQEAVFAESGGINSDFLASNLHGASFVGVEFVQPNFSGADLREVHFEDTLLEEITVNYLTHFDRELHLKWSKDSKNLKQLADLYRAVRLGYENAALRNNADFYLVQERIAYRQHVLWPAIAKNKSVSAFLYWLRDLIGFVLSGYGTSPVRTFWYGFMISLVYAIIYTVAGVPTELYSKQSDFLSALYFSLTTFSTLGYGDLVYDEAHVFMRLLATSEAWIGAIFIAFFVVIFSRKILR